MHCLSRDFFPLEGDALDKPSDWMKSKVNDGAMKEEKTVSPDGCTATMPKNGDEAKVLRSLLPGGGT